MQTENERKATGRFHHWMLPIVLSVLSLSVMLAGDEAAAVLRYERALLFEWEVWRLVSGHFAHLGWSHLLLNLVGLLMVWMFCGHSLTQRLWWVVLMVCSLGISIGLLVLNPSLQWYVGFSGVLHGLLVAGAIAGSLNGYRDNLLLLVLVLVKLGWEQWMGPMPGSESAAGGKVVVDAHLYGAISAALLMATLLVVPAGRQSVLQA